MGYVSAAAAVIGLAMSAFGYYQQGEQQKAQYQYQADMMARNAKIADMNAADAQRRGDIEEKQNRLKVAGLIGTQKSAFASSGVAIEEGSPLEVTSDTAAWGEWEAQTIKHNTAKEIWGIKNISADYRAQSGLYDAAATNAYQGGMFKAGGSLLSGAGTVADKWSSWFPSSTAAPTASSNYTKYGSLAR